MGETCEAPERQQTYFPSTAATTLHAILCSYSALSMRSRRSFRLFKFIMNTYVGGDSSESELSDGWWRGLGFVRSARRGGTEEGGAIFHVAAHLVKAHLVRLFSGDAHVFGGHHGGISHCTVRGRREAENGSSYVSGRPPWGRNREAGCKGQELHPRTHR